MVVPSTLLAQDSDLDDVDDNCPIVPNPLQEDEDADDFGDVRDNCVSFSDWGEIPQCDTDGDGYGNLCDGDFNNDLVVGVPDFNIFRFAFGIAGEPGALIEDCNCNGVTGIEDFNCFRQQRLDGVGPSGLDCAGELPGQPDYCPPSE